MSTVQINAIDLTLDAIADGALAVRLAELVEGLRTRAEEQPELIQDGRPPYVTSEGELVGSLAVQVEARLNPDTGALTLAVKKAKVELPDRKIDQTFARFISGRAMIETGLGRQAGLPFRRGDPAN